MCVCVCVCVCACCVCVLVCACACIGAAYVTRVCVCVCVCMCVYYVCVHMCALVCMSDLIRSFYLLLFQLDRAKCIVCYEQRNVSAKANVSLFACTELFRMSLRFYF